MKDGYLNICITCTILRVAAHRQENAEQIREYDRERSKSTERKQWQAASQQRTYKRYPERRAANISVGNAIRDGRLIKLPCFVCGSVKVEAHHPDYSQHLDVVWLCKQHHEECHT